MYEMLWSLLFRIVTREEATDPPWFGHDEVSISSTILDIRCDPDPHVVPPGVVGAGKEREFVTSEKKSRERRRILMLAGTRMLLYFEMD